MRTRLNHVIVNVSDISKALKWYEKILGFENDGGWPVENPTYYDFKSEEGAKFAIMEVKDKKSHGRLNLEVDNVDELWESLKDKVEIVESLLIHPGEHVNSQLEI